MGGGAGSPGVGGGGGGGGGGGYARAGDAPPLPTPPPNSDNDDVDRRRGAGREPGRGSRTHERAEGPGGVNCTSGGSMSREQLLDDLRIGRSTREIVMPAARPDRPSVARV